jgi:hypothetical protein
MKRRACDLRNSSALAVAEGRSDAPDGVEGAYSVALVLNVPGVMSPEVSHLVQYCFTDA